MVLTALWIIEASVGLFAAVLVLTDGRRILRAFPPDEEAAAGSFRLKLAIDVLVLSGQVVNVVIGMISGVLAGRVHDGVSSALGLITVAGLMLAPALLGGISLITYRARHR